MENPPINGGQRVSLSRFFPAARFRYGKLSQEMFNPSTGLISDVFYRTSTFMFIVVEGHSYFRFPLTRSQRNPVSGICVGRTVYAVPGSSLPFFLLWKWPRYFHECIYLCLEENRVFSLMNKAGTWTVAPFLLPTEGLITIFHTKALLETVFSVPCRCMEHGHSGILFSDQPYSSSSSFIAA